MKILIATYGSRGDVEPMLALARTLRSRGHVVALSLPADVIAAATREGFSCVSSGKAYRECLGPDDDLLSLFPRVARQAEEQLDNLLHVARDADVVIGGGFHVAASTVAELYGAPYAYMALSPAYIRDRVTSATYGRVGGLSLRAQNSAARQLLRDFSKRRARLGLQAMSDPYAHVVLSGTLLIACDAPFADGTTRHNGIVTGAWRQSRHTLGDGFGADVYIGFGSMRQLRSRRLQSVIRESIRRARVKAIFARGWSSLECQSCDITAIDEIDHDSIFPRLKVVIHHGGAGTVAAAARAGVPQIIIPHRGDQFYFAAQVSRLGLGPKPLSLRTVTAKRLADAITEATSGKYDYAVQQIRRRVARVQGLDVAARVIERLGAAQYFEAGER